MTTLILKGGLGTIYSLRAAGFLPTGRNDSLPDDLFDSIVVL